MIFEKFLKMLRKYFIAGMIVIIPLWVTILLVLALANLISNTFAQLPPILQPRTYISFFGIELLIALVFIIFTGLIAMIVPLILIF